ncbi:MAG: phosphoadenosine phosphosulfate reductase domain-containing protein, partial [Planctomycetota bacterium]
MSISVTQEDVKALVDGLNFKQKVDRSLSLIAEAYGEYGDGLVVANSLGKDSVVVWHLTKQVSPAIRGFIVTTRFKPPETVAFMHREVARYPELRVFRNDQDIPDELYRTDPERCCDLLKVLPTRWAIEQMDVTCWVTGLRCTEGRTRTDYQEVEQRDVGLLKLNPILIWHEREIWQYIALHKVDVNPLYGEGYRSLGCGPCTRITTAPNERAGRWIGTSKCGPRRPQGHRRYRGHERMDRPTHSASGPQFPSPNLPPDPNAARLVGLYPQRRQGRWMQRLKLLAGRLTGGQWKALAAIAGGFTPGTPLHLTTRQDIELHDLTPEAVGPVQARMAEANLTGLGACGDTLRNVTVCPRSGAAGDTVDLAPLARQVRAALEAAPEIYSLPRKFKISFSSGPDGLARPWISDLGFVARRRDAAWGFQVVAAGSLGARPGTGMELFDWLGPDAVLPLTRAAVGFFNDHGDREHRSRARLRHVRQRMGDEAFAAALKQRFEQIRSSRDWPDVALPAAPSGFDQCLPLTFPNGDVPAEAAEALGELADRDDLRVRIALTHQILLFGPTRRALAEAVARPALAPAARPQPSVVACPGSRWCSRALVDTNAVADAIRQQLTDRLTPQTRVCISGCP